MNDAARDLIESLELLPHPEGGFYRETFRSDAEVPAHGGTRSAVTSILFLLPTGHRSRLHRVRSDELWLHQRGDDVRLTIGEEETTLSASANLQAAVPGGVWQAAEALPGPAGFALVGCVVAPGFEFEDFELEDE
ncbi:MAG: cupin domain-containing protein [Planctomycetota bacterium]